MEGFAAALEDTPVVDEGEAEEGGRFLEESFFGGEAIVGNDFELEPDGGLGGGELALRGRDGDAEFVGEGAELGDDSFLDAEDVGAVEEGEGAGGEGGVGADFEFAEGFCFASSDEGLGQVFVRLAMMMREDLAGFGMGEDPRGIGGFDLVAIVATLGAGADAVADCLPTFVVATVFAGLDGDEGVGDLVQNGIEDLCLRIEGGEGAAEGDFLLRWAANAEATLGIVELAGPSARS